MNGVEVVEIPLPNQGRDTETPLTETATQISEKLTATANTEPAANSKTVLNTEPKVLPEKQEESPTMSAVGKKMENGKESVSAPVIIGVEDESGDTKPVEIDDIDEAIPVTGRLLEFLSYKVLECYRHVI